MASELHAAKIEQKLQTLQFQNGKLSAQLEVQRAQISELESRVEAQEAKQDTYVETLLTVDNIWTQLNEDIASLTSRAVKGPGYSDVAQPDALASVKKESNVKAEDSNSAAADGPPPPDPYMAKLLRGADAKVKKEAEAARQDLHEAGSDVERQLRARTAQTSAALASLLEVIDAARKRQAPADTPPDAAKQLQELQQECERLTAASDAGVALRRALIAQLKQADAQAQKHEQSIQDLQNDLADRCEELRAAQRKLVMARTASNAAEAAPASPAAPSKQSSIADKTTIADAEAAVQAEQTAKLLEQRTAEVDAEKENVIKLQKEIRNLRAAGTDDSTIASSRLYKELDRQCQQLNAELDRQHAITEGLHHQLESLRRRDHEYMMQAEQAQHTRAQLAHCDARLQEVTAALQAARAERDTAKAQAITAAAGAPQKTINELQSMLTTLQKQNKGLEANIARHRAAANAADALKAEASAARAALAEREEAVRLAQAWADEQKAAAEAARREAEEAAAAGDDLRVMVDVLRTVEDTRVPADLRASEAKLKRDLQAATDRLNGKLHDASAALLKEAEAKAAAREQQLSAQRDQLSAQAAGLQSTIADLKQQLEAAKAENDTYIGEIESIGAAYEEQQGQNARLLTQLAENDRVNHEIVAERVKAVQQAAQAEEERERAVARMKDAQAAASSLQDQIASLQRQLQAMSEEAAAARGAAHHAKMQLESEKRAAAERDAALSERRSAAEAATTAAESAKRSADDAEEKLVREKTKRQRLEDDHRVLQTKLERLRKFDAAGGAEAVLRDEVAAQRKLLRCGVCNSRQKDCVITKCWHLFCQQCIKANLDTRHRKCPGCGSAFGAADVKQVYLA